MRKDDQVADACNTCESTADVAQHQTKTRMRPADSAALPWLHFTAMERYFADTENGVEESSSTPFSMDPKNTIVINEELRCWKSFRRKNVQYVEHHDEHKEQGDDDGIEFLPAAGGNHCKRIYKECEGEAV